MNTRPKISDSDEKSAIYNRVYYTMGKSALSVFTPKDAWERKQKLIEGFKGDEAAKQAADIQIKNAK